MRASTRNSHRSPIGTTSPAPAETYFDDRRSAVDGFVRRHFRLEGTLRLHKASIGWDLARAPVNVALSPVYIASRISAWLLGRIGLQRPSRWLRSRRILFRTAIAKRVDELVLRELLLMPVVAGAETALPLPRGGVRPRIRQVDDYGCVRSAVNEVSVAIATLGIGALVFGAFTPGVLSLTPSAAGALANSAAIDAFPFGSTLDSLWYGVFPADAPVWLVALVGVTLGAAASITTTFAGVIADPIQLRLGVHRRRLLRLIDALEAEYFAAKSSEFVAREQYLARLTDLSDLGVSLVKFLRA